MVDDRRNKPDSKLKIPFFFFKRSNVVLEFGVTVISNVIVGGLIGYYLDRWTFDNRVLLVIFLFLGMASGMYNGIKFLLKEEKRKENERDKEN